MNDFCDQLSYPKCIIKTYPIGLINGSNLFKSVIKFDEKIINYLKRIGFEMNNFCYYSREFTCDPSYFQCDDYEIYFGSKKKAKKFSCFEFTKKLIQSKILDSHLNVNLI